MGKKSRLNWLVSVDFDDNGKVKRRSFMINTITNIIGYFCKNVGLIIGIIEAAIKLAAGIVSLTPNESDDKLIETIKSFSIADKLRKAADILKKLN